MSDDRYNEHYDENEAMMRAAQRKKQERGSQDRMMQTAFTQFMSGYLSHQRAVSEAAQNARCGIEGDEVDVHSRRAGRRARFVASEVPDTLREWVEGK